MSPVKKSKTVSVKKEVKAKKDTSRYIEAVGRRKTAVARVRLFHTDVKVSRSEKNKDIKKDGVIIIINDCPLEKYFPTLELQKIAEDAFRKIKVSAKFKVSAKISGGGIHAQAEALRHGISRALVNDNEDLRKKLKRAGFLRRDPRMKERRKFGLKKARKAPQWSKR